MPSYERLQAWWLDLQQARSDAKLEWLHDECSIRLWRGQLQIGASAKPEEGEWTFVSVPTRQRSRGTAGCMDYEVFRKRVRWSFVSAVALSVCKSSASGPRKTLKNLYQENAVPPWQRQAPLLYIDGELIAVAGVGSQLPPFGLLGQADVAGVEAPLGWLASQNAVK